MDDPYRLRVASARPLGEVFRPVERPVAERDERRTWMTPNWWRLSSFMAGPR
ncbi:hypothetical protein [Umezawaea sp. Da 62-37]|uniref:hypothetical protein n=1 Tax=Umezawaea sp. Da 62-37 TaxID=3075927 RepID=UPI0028F6C455|nr:hypothetical protein [Umezawaea sp. Da 62-37]WNV81916.1 hypothetical protein RM788_27250 [Umezawaea sp. Da 62-37]